MVPECYYMLCPCVYGLEQYCHLHHSCPLCFLLCLVMQFKIETIDVAAVFGYGSFGKGLFIQFTASVLH